MLDARTLSKAVLGSRQLTNVTFIYKLNQWYVHSHDSYLRERHSPLNIYPKPKSNIYKPSNKFCRTYRINRIRQMIGVNNRKVIADQISRETIGLYFAGVNIRKWLAFLRITENDLYVVSRFIGE